MAIWLAAGTVARARSTPRLDQADRFLQPSTSGGASGFADKGTRIPFFDGRLSPLEQRLFADAADGRLDEHSLWTAALVASGVRHAKELQHYQEQFTALVGQLRGSGVPAGPPCRRARCVFEFMHRHVLHAGYRIDATNLRSVIDRGRFNCVSASVLFNCLAGELGLEVCGVETPGHAMSRLVLRGGPLDVETTCPRWFRSLHDPAKQAEMVRNTIGSNSAADRSSVREVSPVAMVAMIYYNRGVELLAAKRFEQAAVANAKALRLDPASVTARGNLLATINNWAIASSNADDFAEAVDLLLEGLAFDPGCATFTPNLVYVHHQWVQHLCEAERFEAALDVLDRAAAMLPDQEYFHRAPAEVRRRWAAALASDGGR